ncbi:MAG: cell division protein FtsQ/DivIB [Lachnospiraceae bacterium]|nr:cell division protein FtsQ/DivIB [Lachnospiraceae bacterium]
MARIRGTLIAVGIIAVILLVVFGVFRVREVEVTGNMRTASEEISDGILRDFWSRNTLFLGFKYRYATTDSQLPYLNTVQVKIQSPTKVKINVSEKVLTGRVQFGGQNVYFDSDAIVLEIGDRVLEDIPLVTGISMAEPVLYQKLPVENEALLRTVLSISQLMKDSQLEPDAIAFDDNLNITIQLGTVTVEIGQNEYLEAKVANLGRIYEQVSGKKGTLNMTAFTGRNESITFREAEEVQTEVPADTESGDGTGEGGEYTGENSGENTGDGGEYTGENSGEYTGENSGEYSGENSGETQEPDRSGQVGLDAFMVFDSSGTLRYDAHVVNGQVVDAYGNPIDGCTVTEDGYVKDAWWNVIDPMTGELAQ